MTMNCVEHLASLLAPAVRIGGLAMPKAGDIDAVIEALQGQIKAGSTNRVATDLQYDTVNRFWQTPRLETLKDARLVAFGLCLPVGPAGECILEDAERLHAMLDGADQWLHDPRWYRRCYQGLVWSYFNCDVEADELRAGLKQNWECLRDYLGQRASATVDKLANPDWVKTVIGNRHVFGEAPCEPYAGKLLRGDREDVDRICRQLGINDASWFLHGLVQVQVTGATKLDHDEFRTLLPSLLEMLSGARTLRDSGLACLLERHAQIPGHPLHERLRDAAAAWWGSPWLPTNALRWSGVSENVRSMVSEWLKTDTIDKFFASLSDGSGQRRAAFWKRYVRSIQKVEVASGEQAALMMTIGRAVVVAFGDAALPLHGHDLRHPATFDMTRPDLRLRHQDGQGGWRQWEQMFEAALRDRFDIRPGVLTPAGATPFVDLSDSAASLATDLGEPLGGVDEPHWQSASVGEDVHWQTAEAASVPYSRPDLEVLARVHSLRLEDETARTGKLWVRANAADRRIARVLGRWGFEYVSGEGWCR